MTVAMADPTDAAAREAIATDLGIEPCVVQGDRLSIDRLVAELWREEDERDAKLFVLAPAGSRVDEIRSYAEYLNSLLGTSLEFAPVVPSVETMVERTSQDCELVILGKAEDRPREALFSGSLELMVLSRLSVSVLIAQRPCWPLRSVLLVIQGEPSDEDATHWGLRLAGPSSATVTALTVVPPVPGMYHGLSRMERGLAELLTTDTALGGQMRAVARRLVDGHIEGKLLLRQGSPGWEIRRELLRGEYDLVVVAQSRADGLRRWLAGDLAVSLMRVVDRPILVAR